MKQTRNNVSREPTININRSTKIFVNFLTAIKYFWKQIFPHFLVAIADLTHPLSNNRSSIRIIGCLYRLLSACAFSILTLNLVLTHGIPSEFRGGVHKFLPAPHTIWSVPSLSGHAIAYRLRSLPRVRWLRASSPQGSSSNGCCLCITMDQMLLCSSLFPHPLLIYSENVQIIGCIKSIQVSKY